MCGLTGFYAGPEGTVNFSKIAYTALLNESRGTDSTGIAIGDRVYKDLGAMHKFLPKIYSTIVGPSLEKENVIIHTRSASIKYGITVAQAHPFAWNIIETTENSDEVELIDYFVGMHNGLIKFENELMKKFILPKKADAKKTDYIVDSQVILHALCLAQNNIEEFKQILSSYEGNAALIFYTKDFFYVWKGANNGLEERPLFYVKKEEGYYFSSLSEGLVLFESKIEPVIDNTLMVFSKGELLESVYIPRTIKTYETTYSTRSNYALEDWRSERNLFQDGSPASGSGNTARKPGDIQTLLPSRSFDPKIAPNFKLLFEERTKNSSIVINGTYSYNMFNNILSEQSVHTYNTNYRILLYFYRGIVLKKEKDVEFERLLSRIANEHYTFTDLNALPEDTNKVSIKDYIFNIIPVTRYNRVVGVLYLEDDIVKYYKADNEKAINLQLFEGNYTIYTINGVIRKEQNIEISKTNGIGKDN